MVQQNLTIYAFIPIMPHGTGRKNLPEGSPLDFPLPEGRGRGRFARKQNQPLKQGRSKFPAKRTGNSASPQTTKHAERTIEAELVEA
jgi:hypothetical protein